MPVGSAASWYMEELMKYPPQFKIGFLSNNPPFYILGPMLKMMAPPSGAAKPQSNK